MSISPYGLSTLMETINNLEREQSFLDDINDFAAGITECSLMDAEECGLVGEDGEPLKADTGMEDYYDTEEAEDSEINKLLENIPEDDDEDVDLESLNFAMEAYIEGIDDWDYDV